MPEASNPATPRGPLAAVHPKGQGALLLLVSVLLAALIESFGIPAALLLGPLLGGILISLGGGRLRVPRLPYLAAQSIVGCLIAGVITGDIVRTFLDNWLLFLALVSAVIVASGILGWAMSRWSVLPGTTAVWGSSPGAASAMMLMADAFGADAQLVAFMQYLRVVFVALAASVMARFLIPAGVSAPPIVWFPPIEPVAFGETLALAAIGGWAGVRLKIPAGAMLAPMLAGTVLHVAGVIQIELPEWLLAISYAILGWNIGLGFTRRIVLHALRALPQIVGSIILLIAFCGGLAFVLVAVLGVDPVTAYLATSPGGMDSVAIIAASTPVDVPFVMALQTVRFLLVLLLGPWLARALAIAAGAREGEKG
ncbi:MAG TPA: AbrB family transcriptional regulator [Devosiaceae bacterium]|jgi:membrane AbrB-like protein|nr:AbrB family transcriptional regulator [Devosiaceae bacterium]